MFDFHEKRKIRSFLYSKAFVSVLFVIAVVMSGAVYNRYTIAEGMKSRLHEKNEELQDLKNRAETLGAKVKYLEDDRGIEEELRNRFDVAKEGEQVIVLIDPKEDPDDRNENATDSNTERKEGSQLPKKRFLDYFKFW